MNTEGVVGLFALLFSFLAIDIAISKGCGEYECLTVEQYYQIRYDLECRRPRGDYVDHEHCDLIVELMGYVPEPIKFKEVADE